MSQPETNPEKPVEHKIKSFEEKLEEESVDILLTVLENLENEKDWKEIQIENEIWRMVK